MPELMGNREQLGTVGFRTENDNRKWVGEDAQPTRMKPGEAAFFQDKDARRFELQPKRFGDLVSTLSIKGNLILMPKANCLSRPNRSDFR